MVKYIESLCDEFRMERSGLHNWLYSGDRLAVTLDEGLDPKTRASLEGVVVEAAERIKKELRVNYKMRK
jgi:hypothetical protein